MFANLQAYSVMAVVVCGVPTPFVWGIAGPEAVALPVPVSLIDSLSKVPETLDKIRYPAAFPDDQEPEDSVILFIVPLALEVAPVRTDPTVKTAVPEVKLSF